MNYNSINYNEIPLGLGMALYRNIPAMQHFSNLSEKDKHAFIEGCRKINSKKEMQDYVESLNSLK